MEKKQIKIKKIKNTNIIIDDDIVICEFPLTIYINNEEFITLLCTPMNLHELSYGLLFSEGFITNKEDVLDIFIDKVKRVCRVNINKKIDMVKKLHGKRARTTGCGKGSIFYHTIDEIKSSKIQSNFKINYQHIINISKELNKKSTLFLETGGVHTTMFINHKKVISYFEDVGRHNTVDKIIGNALINKLDLSDGALFTTGRISSEMLLKTLKAKIPMIISRSAPTDLAVELAREYNVSLIGFVRGERMNIYHDLDRIIYDINDN